MTMGNGEVTPDPTDGSVLENLREIESLSKSSPGLAPVLLRVGMSAGLTAIGVLSAAHRAVQVIPPILIRDSVTTEGTTIDETGSFPEGPKAHSVENGSYIKFKK